jgi:putative endonuclease
MLHCRGGYFYVGHTEDLEARIGQHERGIMPGFVRDHSPAKFVWACEFPSRYEALAMERRIKGWSRAKKLALIRDDWDAISALAKAKSSPSTSSGRTDVRGTSERTSSGRTE